MKLLLAIGHPADVHFFKPFIQKMDSLGHNVVVIAREKEVSFYLLDKFGIDYITISEHKKNLPGKIIDSFIRWQKALKICRQFRPDVSIGLGDFILPQISSYFNFKSIVFTDIEGVFHDYLLTFPFADYVLTPASYKGRVGRNHIRLNGYKELSYIRPDYQPDKSILNELGVKRKEKYIVIRYVSRSAMHDLGLKGLTDQSKIDIVNLLAKYAKIFITSEVPLPAEIKKYSLNISPEKIHDVIYHASLFYGESSTMAAESACMGVPAVFIDAKGRGYTDELETKYNLIYNFSTAENQIQKSVEKGIEILSSDTKQHTKKRRNVMIEGKENMVDFMVRFVHRIGHQE